MVNEFGFVGPSPHDSDARPLVGLIYRRTASSSTTTSPIHPQSWLIPAAHHLNQAPTTSPPRSCGLRNRRSSLRTHVAAFLTQFNSPNRLIVDESTTDDNSGERDRQRAKTRSNVSHSRDPQSQHDGAVAAVPGGYHYCPVCCLLCPFFRGQNLIDHLVARSGVTPCSSA